MLGRLLSKLPAPRPADWGWKVSVCIAYVCEHERQIVTISDQRVSFGDFSADNAVIKSTPLTSDWIALCAGNDVEYAEPILKLGSALMRAAQASQKSALSPLEIAGALDDAYSHHLRSHIEKKFLRKHGYTFESFRKLGRRQCTPEVYVKTWDKIEREKFSLKFLLCGFDAAKKAHIYVVDGEGQPSCYDSIGYWAIGRGALAALSEISFHVTRGSGSHSTLSDAIYIAATAKFMAETASDVGIGTFLCILSYDGTDRYIQPQEVFQIRKLWEESGSPRIPKEARAVIPKLIYDPVRDREKFLKREFKLLASRKSSPGR